MKGKLIRFGAFLFAALTVSQNASAQALVASVLPTSRAVQVGQTATAFATIINPNATSATGCSIAPVTSIPAAFHYQTTDASNQPTGTPDTPTDIAAGAAQSFVISFAPSAGFAETNVQLSFDCGNTDAAANIDGVNTFRLAALTTPAPDVVALSATLANDGIVRTPGSAGTGVFSVAAVNLGATGTLKVSASSGTEPLAAALFICETDAVGACLAPPAASVDTTIASNATPTFGVFVQGSGEVIPLDPALYRAFVRFENNSGASFGSTSVAVQTQTEMSSQGGTLNFDGASITLPETIANDVVSFSVEDAPPPSGVPSNLMPFGTGFDIGVSDETKLDGPVEMTIDYDDTGIGQENEILVIHQDPATGAVVPATVLSQDTAGNKVTIDSRDFSYFYVALLDAALPGSFTVPGWDVVANSWNINNFGNYFSPGGNCLGMSAYCDWFFRNDPATLNTAYSTAGPVPTSQAHLVAARAHLAQSQFWAIKQFAYQQVLPTAQLGRLMKAALFLQQKPLVLILGTNGSPRHASVLYGYDANNFYFYDVNALNAQQSVTFNGSVFGTYGAYNSFGYVAIPSLGRTEDFQTLTNEARAGFVASSNMTLSAPAQGAVIEGRETQVIGSLSGEFNSLAELLLYVNGVQQVVPVNNGNFQATIPVQAGENTILAVAGVNVRDQSRWYPNAATIIRTFNGTTTAAALRVTLTWNQNNTDVDLYVTEPGGETAWWLDQQTSNGLELDFDNVEGFGPENTTLSPAEGDTVQPGNYMVNVHYFSDHLTEQPATGSVSMVVNEGTAQEVSRVVNFNIATSDPNAAGPGGTGPSWRAIANVDLINGVIDPL